MNIFMIGHKFVPSREGGIEIVVEKLSTQMASLGHNVVIFNRRRKGKAKNDYYKGCTLKSIFTIDNKYLDAIVYAFISTLQVRREAKKNCVDVIHFHALGPCIFLRLLPKKNKRNYKIVVTVHGLDWQRNKWGGFASKLLKFGEKQVVKYADEIIVLSNNMKDYFKDNYNIETNYIPNGVDKAEEINPNIISKKYNLSKNDYILFLARIVPEKGLHYLIEAWNKLIHDKEINLKLVIAGGQSHDSNYYKKIQNMIKDNKSIIFTGFVEGTELKELFSNAYLYVLPSDVEGMPISLLEALSYGNICLVSDIPENAEINSENIYLFKHGNVQDLTDKLGDLIDLNLIKRDSCIAMDTWDKVVDKTLELYER